MKHNIFTIILLTFFASASSFAATSTRRHLTSKEYFARSFTEKNWHLRLKLNQRADAWDSKLENSIRYRIYVSPNFSLKMSENFFLTANVSLGDTIGSVQSRFGDLRADSFIYLRDARMYYRNNIKTEKNDYFYTLSLGAIEQRRFLRKFDLFMSKRALPGFEQIFKFSRNYRKKKSFGFDLRFFEGVPTSQAKTLDFNEKEDIPLLLNGRLEMYLKDMDLKPFGYRAGLSIGYFDFSSLPAVIADESRIFGNTVDGIGGAAEFRYDFKGWYAGWTAAIGFNRFEIFPYIDMITNTAAPSGRNQGQRAGVHFKYHDKSLYSLDLEPFSFFNESDASVASYNGSTYGHNNREGFGINLALELPKRDLKFWLTYVYSDILEENSDLQVPYHFVGFKMEYKHDL
ncbi:MAG: hypothetical protein ACRBBP_04850 [Bdellovibrionales bacterium]